MTQQEYSNKIAELNRAISDLKRVRDEIRTSYFDQLIEEDPYKGFEKVELTYQQGGCEPKTIPCFIYNRCLFGDKLEYQFCEVKKDGSPSSRQALRWINYDILSMKKLEYTPKQPA